MNQEQQISLTKTVMQVLANWKVSPEDQVFMLGLDDKVKPRKLNSFRNGMAIPESSSFVERAQLILAIQNAVDSLYPHNGHAANLWITTNNNFFCNKMPLTVMLEEGVEGMQRVYNRLNGYEDWG